MKECSKLKHIIVGTAGHIDHGKTTLIRAITGRDTDRLEEENEEEFQLIWALLILICQVENEQE